MGAREAWTAEAGAHAGGARALAGCVGACVREGRVVVQARVHHTTGVCTGMRMLALVHAPYQRTHTGGGGGRMGSHTPIGNPWWAIGVLGVVAARPVEGAHARRG